MPQRVLDDSLELEPTLVLELLSFLQVLGILLGQLQKVPNQSERDVELDGDLLL